MFSNTNFQGHLGMHCLGLNAENTIIFEAAKESSQRMPAASTVKVAIALTVLTKMYNSHIDFTHSLTINNNEFSPGSPTNTFDMNFFIPTERTVSATLKDLLEAMLTESDNSATDKLLDWIGGTQPVNELVASLGIYGFKLSKRCKQLLADFYGIDTNKSFLNIFRVLDEFCDASSMRATESTWATRDEDTCTPEAMSLLIKCIVANANKTDNTWLTFASKHVFEIMQRCKSGNNLIKAAANTLPHISHFGHKTGGLGSIRNDTAFIEFENGNKIILTIFSYASLQSLKLREELIQQYAKSIITKAASEMGHTIHSTKYHTICL